MIYIRTSRAYPRTLPGRPSKKHGLLRPIFCRNTRSNQTTVPHQAAQASAGIVNSDDDLGMDGQDRAAQIASIEATFAAAQRVPVHQKKPELTAVEILPGRSVGLLPFQPMSPAPAHTP